MRARLTDMASLARAEGSAIAAFTCYDFTTACAVVAAAETSNRPAVLLVSPSTAAAEDGLPLIRALRSLADHAAMPVSVQLDHATNAELIDAAVTAGADAVLADGSRKSEQENADFVARTRERLHRHPDVVIEAELGRIEGNEDIARPQQFGAMTEPERVASFLRRSGADLLAVSIGNVHGHYAGEVHLDWRRLSEIVETTSVPLVLHGASGLPSDAVERAIKHGICKININTELRRTVFDTLSDRVSRHRDHGLDLASLGRDWRSAVLHRAAAAMAALNPNGVSV